MRHIIMGFVAPALCFAPACTHAQDGGNRSVKLFDGQTLEGWQPTQENPDSFSVEDGAIKVHGPRAHLFYDGPVSGAMPGAMSADDISDFELSLRVKTEPGANSGVFFHTTYQAEGWPAQGLEAQVNATQKDTRKTGSLYAVSDIRVYSDREEVAVAGMDRTPYGSLPKPPHADGEWFDYVIRVEDGTATTRVNGRLLVEWTQPENWADPKRRLGQGTFALQAHDPDSVVYYKDLVLTRLD